MKRLLAAAGALLCLLSVAHAQLTTITASSIKMGGTPIASGSVSFTPVSSYGIPIPFSTGGGGLNSPQAFSCTITAGAIAAGCQVPDAQLTTPANILYAIQVVDSGSGRTFTLQAVPNVTGATWALDHYGPSVPTSSSQNLSVGIGPNAPPSPCATPTFYIQTTTTPQLTMCVNGVPVPVSGAAGAAFTGGTLTSPLILSADPVSGLGAATKQFVASAVSSVPRSNALNGLRVIADTAVDQNQYLNSDGSRGWHAGPGYDGAGTWIDDLTLTAMSNPGKFSAADILNQVARFAAAVDAHGQIPAAVNPAGATSQGFSGNDQHGVYVDADGWSMMPQLCYLHYKKTGATACYTQFVNTVKTAQAYFPRNPSTHMPTIVAGNEYLCQTEFQEVVRNTGDVLACAVLLAGSDKVMLEMATAAGDVSNATFFSNELATMKAGLQEFTDTNTQALKAATGQNSANIDLVNTSLAVFWELLPPAQELSISAYFHSNLASFTHDGYVLQSPTQWAYIGIIPSSGGPPYIQQPSGFGAGQYQDAYWSLHTGWFAYALAKAYPSDVPAFLASFRDGPDPSIEWYNRDFTNGTATTPNMESSQGAAWAADNILAPTPVNAGVAYVNKYGAIVNGTGGASGGVTQNGETTFNGGSSQNLPLAATSDSTANTALPITNTTSSTTFNFLLNGSSGGAYAGAGCFLFTSTNNSFSPVAPVCFDRVNSIFGVASTYSLRWNSGVAGGSGTDVGFSRHAAGVLQLDGGTVGDGQGIFSFVGSGGPAVRPAGVYGVLSSTDTTYPQFIVKTSGAGTDAKLSRYAQYGDGSVHLQLLNDAMTAATDFMVVARSGATVTSVTLPVTPTLPLLKANSGTRYVCVDTNGNLVSSTTACSGT